MHLMLRNGREMNAEHPWRKKFLVDLSQAVFTQHEGDRELLMMARDAAKLKRPPTLSEWVKYIRRVVGEPEFVARRMLLMLNALREIDKQCYIQAQSVGLEVDNITPANMAYPLISKRVTTVFQQ